MLNRETGAKPVLSRSCNAEQALKCHWVKTGKARQAMKQSQKNCLIQTQETFCDRRNGANRKELLRLSAFLRTGVLFLRQKEAQSAFNFPASETRQARQGKLKNKLLMRCIFDVEK